jgi:hypothetical protein
MRTTRFLIMLSLTALILSAVAQKLRADDNKDKATSFQGKVFRSDTKQPVANAVVLLLDEKKSDKQDNSVEVKTDDKGNFAFDKVAAGRYTISIRAWYEHQEDVPCQLLAGKTQDKDSAVVVMKDGNRFVEQIFIKGVTIKAGKPLNKDFDLVCKSAFEK